MASQVVLVGCGGIGLPLAVAFARAGRIVLGVDVDAGRVARLARGECDLVEEGLAAALRGALDDGRITFATTVDPAQMCRAFVVAVPTPASAAHGFDDIALAAASAMIMTAARDGDLVCVRSTVPIGMTRRLAAAPGAQRLRFAACPDRSLAGRAYTDQFVTPHLVGGLDATAADRATELFAGLAPVVRTRDPETAEAIKLFANVTRDVHFAMANQLAIICETVGIDAAEVLAAGAEGYPRFRPARPGPVGGPCLTKDVHVLASSHAAAGLDLGLLMAARAVNESLASRLAREILARQDAQPGPVAILGMAFKGAPPTADRRNAFGDALAHALRQARPALDVRTWDPVAPRDGQARRDAVRGAAVVVLANDHPDLARCVNDLPLLAPSACVYDLTGVLPPGALGPGVELRRFGDGRSGR